MMVIIGFSSPETKMLTDVRHINLTFLSLFVNLITAVAKLIAACTTHVLGHL